MAYGVLYTASIKDRLQVKSFRVDILQEDYVSGSTAITYMAVTPVVLKYHSTKGEEQYVQGSSLTFSFKSLVADNDKYDALFEGYEKEFKIKYYDITSGDVLIWEGYIQSDNLSRSYTDNIYEITLNATDWLSNLKEVEFKNGAASYTGNVTVLSAIKTCLEFVGIELDFWVQLNTYETTYMTSTSQVLKLTYVDLARFTKVENGKTKFTSVYDVLTHLIKPFNLTLKQVRGYYKIVNFYELISFFYTFTWADFTASSRTASPNADTIDDYTITRDSNYTKLKPILRLDFKRNSNDIGGELVADTDDFTGGGPWTITAPDGYSQITDRITITDDNPTTNDNNIICSTGSLSPVASKYIKVAFDLDYNVGEQWEPISYSVRITKPGSGEAIDEKITGTAPFHFESTIKDMYAIDESGVYTIEINVSDSSQPYTSGTVAIYNVRINSINLGDPEFDQNYIAYIDVDGQVKEDEIYFSDANTNTDQGGFKVYNSGFVKTLAWNSHGGADGVAIHELWASNILKSRQFYKDLITINIIDDSFNLHADSILRFAAIGYYKITEIETIYNKSIHKIIMEFVETVDPSYTFSNTPLTTINGESTETDSPTGEGTSHSLLDGLTSDDHLQYHNNTRGDARYYSQSAIDANFYSKTEIDTNIYTKTQSDARYYTQTQIDANFYTQSYLDSNFASKAFVDTWYYTKIASDARFRKVADPLGVHADLSLLNADDHTQYHNNARGDARYAQLTAANAFTNTASWSGTGQILSIGSGAVGDSAYSLFNSRAYMGYISGNAIIQGRSGKGIQFAVNNDTFGSGITAELLSGGQFKNRYFRAFDTNGISFEISSGTEFWLMDNNGDFHAEGDVVASSTTVSDKRLKKNINPLNNALEKILKIKGVSFKYVYDSDTHIGILAQDLKEIIPELVIEKELPLKGKKGQLYYVIRYTELIPYIIEAIKEQQTQIDKNAKEIEKLKMFNLNKWGVKL